MCGELMRECVIVYVSVEERDHCSYCFRVAYNNNEMYTMASDERRAMTGETEMGREWGREEIKTQKKNKLCERLEYAKRYATQA